MTDFAALLQAVAGRTVPAGLADAMARVLPGYGIDTPIRIAHFVGQVCEETGGFRVCVENLNYSAEGLLRTWPSRYTPELAAAHAHHPALIAEHVYGGRLGNAPEGSGEAAKWIGRSLIQITGHDNYAQAQADTGLPLLDHPELLAEWGDASVGASAAFWRRAGCNELADADGLIPITRKINGALLNLETRRLYVGRAKAEISRQSALLDLAAQPEPQPAAAPVAPIQPPAQADAPPTTAAPIDADGQPIDIPSFGRSLWTAYGHRALAWLGGIFAAIAAFARDHPAELILFAGLALLIVLIVLAVTRTREADRDHLLHRALAAQPPAQT